MRRIKIFLSHSSKDGTIGQKIKTCFEKCVGFEVFFSTSDLAPSDNFHEKILINLDSCDFFIPLISNNLKKSFFANQEIGVAIGKETYLIPIDIDQTKPYGLIDHIQGEPCESDSEEDILKAVSHIFVLCIQHTRYITLRPIALNSLIFAFEQSDSFISTSIMLNLLIESNRFVSLSKEQLNKLIYASKHNPNIYSTTFLFPKLRLFLHRNYNVSI